MDRETLVKALRNAHNAGDIDAARRIAVMLNSGGQDKFAAEPEVSSGAADFAKSFGSGVARGAAGLLDMPSLVGQLGMAGIEKGYEFATGEEMNPAFKAGMQSSMKVGPVDLSRANVTEAANSIAPDVMGYEPETTAGEYAQTVGEFLPGGAGGGIRGAASVAAAGLASEAAGQATEGTDFEPYARILAAIGTPTVGSAMLRRIVSPFGGTPSPARLEMVKILDDAGVPLTAGQKTGSDALRRIEGRSGTAGNIASAQGPAFTKAALKTIGENADAATPEVLSRATKRIGAVFDDAVSGVALTPTPSQLVASSKVLQMYRQMKPQAEAAPLFNNINKALVDAARSGKAIDAKNAKSWRSVLSKLTKSSDTATREAAVDMMDVIDDAFSEALRSSGKADLVDKLATARAQYRNLLAIETAASRAGEATAQGILSPSQLRNAVVLQGRRAYTQGKRGDIGDLTRAAEAVMKPLPTTEAGGLRDMRGVAELLGAGVGSTFGPAGAMAGVAAPTVMREAAGLPVFQRYLQNQLIKSQGGYAPAATRTLPGLLSQ